MTDQTPQHGLYGPQGAPGDSRAAEGAHDAPQRRTAARDGLREQYVLVISRVLLDSAGRLVPKHIAETAKAVADAADAVLAERDRELEQLRARAEQAEDLLRVAHETSNKSEAERARAVQRADLADRVKRSAAKDAAAALERAEQAEAENKRLRAELAEERRKHGNTVEVAGEFKAAIARVRDAAALHRKGLISTAELYAVIGPALDDQQQDDRTAH